MALIDYIMNPATQQDSMMAWLLSKSPYKGMGSPSGSSSSGLPSVNLSSIQGPNIQGPNIQGPNIQGPNIQGPNIQGPRMPNLPSLQAPNLPNLQAPNLPSINLPNIPGFGLPSLPAINLPALGDWNKTAQDVAGGVGLNKGSLTFNPSLGQELQIGQDVANVASNVPALSGIAQPVSSALGWAGQALGAVGSALAPIGIMVSIGNALAEPGEVSSATPQQTLDSLVSNINSGNDPSKISGYLGQTWSNLNPTQQQSVKDYAGQQRGASLNQALMDKYGTTDSQTIDTYVNLFSQKHPNTDVSEQVKAQVLKDQSIIADKKGKLTGG